MGYMACEERYEEMIYHRCGKSGLLLPAISLGLWQHFSDKDIYANCCSIILKAFDKGITHFDLANNYGNPAGSSEKVFGRILNENLKSYRDEILVSTKAGYDMWAGPYGEWGSRKYMMASIDQSLKRMGLDYVDIFYSHRPDPNTPLEETMGALVDIVRQGKALYVGLSNYSPEMTEMAIKILDQSGVHCLIHQPKYSLLDRQPEEKLMSVLEKHGVGCIAFQPLAQGLLTNKYFNGIPDDSRIHKGLGALKAEQLTPELLNCIKKLDNIAKGRGQSLAQMSIVWLLNNNVTSVLLGASSVNQLEENIKSLENKEFNSDELIKIESIVNKCIHIYNIK